MDFQVFTAKVYRALSDKSLTLIYGRNCSKKVENGHYEDAVEIAFKMINNRVKEIHKKCTGEELDGSALMVHAFNAEKPIIDVGDSSLSLQSQQNMQEGYIHLFVEQLKEYKNQVRMKS